MSINDSKVIAMDLPCENPQKTPAEKSKGLTQISIDGIVEYIKSGECRNVVTLAEARISTSSGIPDFKGPISGCTTICSCTKSYRASAYLSRKQSLTWTTFV